METRRIFIVGDSLFAESLIQMLGEYQTIQIIGSASASPETISKLQDATPDVVLVAGTGDAIIPLLVACPDLPVIHTDLNTNRVQVITNQTIDARISDLLAAIAALPRRGLTLGEESQT